MVDHLLGRPGSHRRRGVFLVADHTDGPNGLAFSADYETLYIGSFDNGGVKSLDLASGELAVINDSIPDVDGVLADVCGNVYVAIYGSNELVRISPDGVTREVIRDMTDDPEMFGHGITWGSGLGGFASDHIYQPTPKPSNNPVAEVRVGVPYRDWPGAVINRD